MMKRWSATMILVLLAAQAGAGPMPEYPVKPLPVPGDSVLGSDSQEVNPATGVLRVKQFRLGLLPVSTPQQAALDAKADRMASVMDWDAHPTGATFTTASPGVWYSGKLYKCLDLYTKTSGATPDTLGSYFAEVTGGTGSGVDTDDQTALEVPFTPNGSIAATNVQTAIQEVRDDNALEAAGKQDVLGYVPEDAANKGVANGYAGLGSDGKVPAGQLPASSGTDDQTAAEVPASPWGDYTGTNAQTLIMEVDSALRALIGGGGSMTWPAAAGVAVYNGSSSWGTSLTVGTAANNLVQLTGTGALPAVSGANLTDLPGTALPWMPATGPTAANQIIQATGAGASIWTDVVNGLINDAGSAVDDLLSAAEINARIATSAAAKQNTLGYTAENAANKGAVNGYASLGADGLVPTAQLPAIQSSLEVPSLAEAQEGTATDPRAWTAQRVAQAIVALAPAGSGGEEYFEVDGGSAASLTFTGSIDGGASI